MAQSTRWHVPGLAPTRPLGIIPNGSGNGLARELQIPMGAEDAIEVLPAIR